MTISISIPAAGMQREPVPAAPRVVLVPRSPVAAASTKESPAILEPTREDALVAELNQKLKLASIGVQFEFDKETNSMITRVMDMETGELIRQMPSEEVMKLSKALGKLHDLLALQAICRKAQLTDHSRAPAPARWSSSWAVPDAPAFKSVKV